MSSSLSPQTIELDILGQVCPACLLVVLKEINQRRREINSGQTRLLIRTDHRNATVTVPESVRKMGYRVDVSKLKTYYQIVVDRQL